MSNLLKNMQKIPDTAELRQRELQKQSIIVNTRFNLASTFLNTLIGRQDADVTDADNISALTDISVDYANALMTKLGMITAPKTDD